MPKTVCNRLLLKHLLEIDDRKIMGYWEDKTADILHSFVIKN